MKIKHKGIRMFKQIRRMMSLAMLMPSFLLAAPDYKQKFTQILDLQ
ncbi:virB2 type IV secretion protein [Helicobacter pylori]|nr:virB2 type IV secretion protein [Helicobacter pylori]